MDKYILPKVPKPNKLLDPEQKPEKNDNSIQKSLDQINQNFKGLDACMLSLFNLLYEERSDSDESKNG